MALLYIWRHDLLLSLTYLGLWLAFSLYSFPPVRLKVRGLAGVFADAAGAHLFPALFSVVLVFRQAHRPIDPGWIVLMGLWALAYGLRGILWHQLGDLDNDRAAGARTFVVRHSRHGALWLGVYVAFPLEVLALGGLIWWMQSWWPVMFMALSGVMIPWKARLWGLKPIIVTPRPKSYMALTDYYQIAFPASILIAAALRSTHDIVILVMHLLLFPGGSILAYREILMLTSLGWLFRTRKGGRSIP